jgi:hypothetical protein
MKRKADFVTNSSSTSFTFVFEGDKRTDLFKKLVKYEKEFDVTFEEWQGGFQFFDVWDLIENLINLIKKGPQDRYYLPDIKPITGLIDSLEASIMDYTRVLKEEREEIKKKPNKDRYILNLYNDKLKEANENVKVLKELVSNSKKFSFIEMSFGNDGIVDGNYGYAMEQIKSIKPKDDFFVIIESRH